MLSNGEKLTGTLLTALSPPTGLSSSLLNNNQANLMSPMNSSELLNLKHINDTINFNNHVASIDQWSSGLMSNYGSPPNHMNSGPASASSSNMGMNEGSSGGDDTTKKRQVRLQKNREAAKECRRKKKEYVKCLEHRVTVLERQNKALIEELKALKELYCQKGKEGL
uniref:BZIP domain-containing protein n=1 Tax=Rhabditophanes sp. KR3021 TaxID=114890 RepID=A0AC35TZY9_9BILA